jgi:hypothetical protein
MIRSVFDATTIRLAPGIIRSRSGPHQHAKRNNQSKYGIFQRRENLPTGIEDEHCSDVQCGSLDYLMWAPKREE